MTYHIRGIVGIRLLNNGSISRQESEMTYHLNTEIGVVRFIEEFNPWLSIVIKEDQIDATNRFKKHIVYTKPRSEMR